MTNADDIKAIQTTGELVRVSTLSDGSFRITFDVPNYGADVASWLLKECAKTNVVHEFVIAQKEDDDEDGGDFL